MSQLTKITQKISVNNIIVVVAVAMCIFHLSTGVFGSLPDIKQNSVHLLFVLILVFLIYPAKRGTEKKKIPFYDWILILLSIACGGYIIFNYTYISAVRIPYITPLLSIERILGVIIVVLVIEATRRTVGLFLSGVAVFMIGYVFLGTYLPGSWAAPHTGLDMFLDIQYLTTGGIFGLPLKLSATYIVLLIIFGAIMLETGFGEFIYTVAMAVAGRARGGPAKVAVVSSAFFGSISGSGSANVAVTGNFSIPLMKRMGYEPHVAGAVEAVASTGGQIMPPIMGAAAFIMAEFLGVSYISIIKCAVIPALLYFISVFFMMDLHAAKRGLKGLEKDEMPPFKKNVLAYGHVTLAMVTLLYLMTIGRTVFYAVTVSIFATFFLSFFRKATRLTWQRLVRAFLTAAKGTIIVALACAVAGLMIGSIFVSGLQEKFVVLILNLCSGYLVLGLIATMVAAIVLGMGMPTSAAYVLMASLIVPALVKGGVTPIAANMFAMYFACLSLITPPVATASYVAAGIAGSSMTQTAVEAVKLATASYIVPFMFVFDPSILFEGSIWSILLTFVTAIVGVFALAVCIQGYLYTRINPVQRVICFGVAILLIKSGLITDIMGIVILGLVCFSNRALSVKRLNKHEGGREVSAG